MSNDRFWDQEALDTLDAIVAEIGPNATLAEAQNYVLRQRLTYWSDEAIAVQEAFERLASRIATAEGLSERSQEWADRVISIEDEARGKNWSPAPISC